jgi:hypothetical protein
VVAHPIMDRVISRIQPTLNREIEIFASLNFPITHL